MKEIAEQEIKEINDFYDSRKRTRGDYSRTVLAVCAIGWLAIYFALIYFKILR